MLSVFVMVHLMRVSAQGGAIEDSSFLSMMIYV